jgi:hypothetical protein
MRSRAQFGGNRGAMQYGGGGITMHCARARQGAFSRRGKDGGSYQLKFSGFCLLESPRRRGGLVATIAARSDIRWTFLQYLTRFVPVVLLISRCRLGY